MADIFISYTRADRSIAEMYSLALQAEGWSVWYDAHIPPGPDFETVIDRELALARCVLVLWSSTSRLSDWVREEAEDAKTRGVIVPVKIEPTDVPRGFRRLQTEDLTHWKAERDDEAWQRVLARVGELTGKVAPSQAQAYPSPMPATRDFTPALGLSLAAVFLIGVVAWIAFGPVGNVAGARVDLGLSIQALLYITIALVFWFNLQAARGGPHYEKWLSAAHEPRVGQAYLSALSNFLDNLSLFIGDKKDDNPHPGLSAQAYVFCLGLAIVYSPVLLFLSWAVWDGSGGLGNVLIWPEGVSEDLRRITLVAFLGGFAFVVAGWLDLQRQRRLLALGRFFAASLVWYFTTFALGFGGGILNAVARDYQASGPLLFGAIISILAFGLAVAIYWVFTGRLVWGTAAAFAGAAGVALLSAHAHPAWILLVFALSAAIALAARAADERGLGTAAAILLSTLIIGLAAMTWALALGDAVPASLNRVAPLVLLLSLLPAINAPLAWLSLGASRYLLGKIAEGEHAGFRALAWAAASILFGFFFLAFVAAATVFGLSFADAAAQQATGGPVVDVRALLGAMHANPADAQYMWIYAMLLTTLVWTAIHFTFAILAGCSTILSLEPIRAFVLAKLRLAARGDLPAQQWVAIYNTLRWSISIVGGVVLMFAPLAIFGGSLGQFVRGLIETLLLPIAETVAARAN
jgi:hypothetical protein